MPQIYSYIYIRQCVVWPFECTECDYRQETSRVGNTTLKCFEVRCTLKDTDKEKPQLAQYLPETPSCVLQRAETGHFRLRRRREDLEEKLDTIKNLEGKLDAILNNQDQFRLKMDQIERKLEETQTEMVSVKQDASDMKGEIDDLKVRLMSMPASIPTFRSSYISLLHTKQLLNPILS